MVVNPGITYVSSKSDALLLEKLKEGLGPDAQPDAFDVRLEKASFFNPNNVRPPRPAASLIVRLSGRIHLQCRKQQN